MRRRARQTRAALCFLTEHTLNPTRTYQEKNG